VRRRLRSSASTGVAQFLFGAALAVLLTAGAALASPSADLAVASQVSQDSASRGAQTLVRRPFQHVRHEDLPCRGCHGSGAAHRTTRVRAPTDCAACHHDPARALSCSKCHTADAIPAQRSVRLTLTLQVAEAPRVREVTFRHDVHIATIAGLTCKDCHGTEVTLARNRECGSCHSSHHAGKADCASCHTPPRRDAHDTAVHLTCAGSACHATAKAPSPTLSRATCLFCHADRRDHEPEGSCAVCHRIPGASGLAGSGLAVRSSAGGRP
jgi:hypothetical protein